MTNNFSFKLLNDKIKLKNTISKFYSKSNENDNNYNNNFQKFNYNYLLFIIYYFYLIIFIFALLDEKENISKENFILSQKMKQIENRKNVYFYII